MEGFSQSSWCIQVNDKSQCGWWLYNFVLVRPTEWPDPFLDIPWTLFLYQSQAHYVQECSNSHYPTQLIQNFHLPLSIQAHTQLQELKAAIARLQIQEGKDIWHYTWGNSNFTAAKAYRVMIGHRPVHPIFQWIWSSRCQMKHKVFFWLLLQDRLSTRVLLRRRTLELDNYSCDHCILQKLETVTHLFLRCNFAKACWASIGAAVRTSRPLLGIFRLLKEKL